MYFLSLKADKDIKLKTFSRKRFFILLIRDGGLLLILLNALKFVLVIWQEVKKKIGSDLNL